MFRILKADKDTYITDRVVGGSRHLQANVGRAGTIDLFKLYGVTMSGSYSNNEVSRALIHFDLSDIFSLHRKGKIDITSSTFKCTMKLHDIYGGQTTPANFTLIVHPLSQSWDEGLGTDIVQYNDIDSTNFVTASWVSGSPVMWNLSGANAKGTNGSLNIDVITASNGIIMSGTQYFNDGTEDLEIDVTTIVSATLTSELQDLGFRISFSDTEENDRKTWFVKRFASKQAGSQRLRPKLLVKYNDSVEGLGKGLYFDDEKKIILYNKVRGSLTNIISGSTQVTGTNCIKLRLEAAASGGMYALYFTGSQHSIVAGTFLTGVYSANVTLSSSNATLMTSMLASGTQMKLKQVWFSLDNSVTYITASDAVVNTPDRTNTVDGSNLYRVSIQNVNPVFYNTEVPRLRATFQNVSTDALRAVRKPLVKVSDFPNIALYSIRDAVTNDVVVPFDATYNSTKMSIDELGYYFDLYPSDHDVGSTYVIDVMTKEGEAEHVYRSVSPAFRIEKEQ